MRGSEWAPLYMLLVLAIAGILLVTFVKPLFRQAAVTADQNTQQAKDAAKSLLPFVAFWPLGQRRKKNRNLLLALLSTLGITARPQPMSLTGGGP